MLASPWFGLTLLNLASGALCLFACLQVEPTTNGPAHGHAAASLTAAAMGCGPMVLA
jgi:hypothetical protein